MRVIPSLLISVGCVLGSGSVIGIDVRDWDGGLIRLGLLRVWDRVLLESVLWYSLGSSWSLSLSCVEVSSFLDWFNPCSWVCPQWDGA